MVKHVQIRMEKNDYTRLRMLCAMRGCNLQTFLVDLIRDHVQNAPELKDLEEK